jgi:peptidyl-prolyl cis-trans isomerase C
MSRGLASCASPGLTRRRLPSYGVTPVLFCRVRRLRPFRRCRLRGVSALLFAAILLVARAPRADVAPDASAALDAHRSTVVAHVGLRAITAGELENDLARVPRYQLRVFGTTAPEVVRGFFAKVVLPDVLLSLGAEDRHLAREVEVEQALDRTLSSATLREVLASVGPSGAVSPDEVQRYYDSNRARYDAKDRVYIWRILCATREEALAVLAEAKKDGTVPTFTKLSRDHNLDKATALRGGNLGFVGEGGVSSEPGVLVEAAVLKAAQGVKDGELVSTVVPEGTGFAVVWRRGTQPAVHHTVDDVRAQIQDAILRQKRETAEAALLGKLRAAKVSEVNESLLGTFDVAVDDGTIGPRKRAPSAPSR